MEFSRDELSKLITQLDFGSSTAEKDTLLETARIETSVFTDMLLDRVDLIRGTKGSGKTALFRIFTKHLSDHFYKDSTVIIINGAEEPAGDPIFQSFKPRFEQLAELDFQNFWRVYFVALINKDVFTNEKYRDALTIARKDVEAFHDVCRKNSFPFEKKARGLKYIVNWALGAIKALKYSATVDADGRIGVSVEPTGDEAGATAPPPSSETPIFINEVRTKILDVLRKANLKVWIMVDRLDEIFPRRSDVETRALRSLLLTTNSFPDERLRLKLFLRDDIFASLIDPEKGFTALTHVTDRASDVLNWDRELVCKLIVKRIFCYEQFRRYFKIDQKRLEKDRDYQRECFGFVFPPKVERGMDTLDWIYSRCQDGQGVVTPRDVIDLLQFARSEQATLFKESPESVKTVMSFDALKYGYGKMSERKVNTYLRAEFPHLWTDYLARFENQKATLSKVALARILGTEDPKIPKILAEVGFLRFIPKKGLYSVPYLYRHGMKMVQGTELS